MASDKELSIILLEDQPADAERIQRALREGSLRCHAWHVKNRAGFNLALIDRKPDIVLTDDTLPDFSALDAVNLAHEKYPDVPVIVVTDGIGDIGAVELIKAGARDYVLKNQLERLPHAVEHVLAEALENRERQRAHENLQQSLKATVVALASTMELRDEFTAGHQRRVSSLATCIAAEMGLPDDQIEGISFGATIHDLGKVAVPVEVLGKIENLTPDERQMIKSHVPAGYNVLKDIDFPWPIATMVQQHHERLDGSGYPQGLKGDDIILEARVLAVADVVAAMVARRPHRPGLGIDVALAEIEKDKGTKYDARVVDACLKVFHEKGFAFR